MVNVFSRRLPLLEHLEGHPDGCRLCDSKTVLTCKIKLVAEMFIARGEKVVSRWYLLTISRAQKLRYCACVRQSASYQANRAQNTRPSSKASVVRLASKKATSRLTQGVAVPENKPCAILCCAGSRGRR